MRTLKMTVSYHGGQYAGWQVQTNGVSIQELLETAWNKITGEQIRIIASGRTDAGVHALGQVCSLQTESELAPDVLVRALNANTPQDICVLQIDTAPDNFHAIRDAVEKTYRYQIQRGELPSVFHSDRAWYIPGSLELPAMKQAAVFLVGKHDFASFQASGSDRATTVRTVSRLDIESATVEGFEYVTIEITADGFLYNMVRNIVGTLVEVGQGRYQPDDVEAILESRDRKSAGVTAPARGLFLVNVNYEV